MKTNDILAKVKLNLSTDRYEHTLRVMQTAKKLAEIHQVDVEKVEIASVLHDYAKCESKTYLKEYVIDHKLGDDLLNYHHELWHAHVGAHYAEYTLGIKDQFILNAIKYHTTGRPHMEEVELVVFIADYIEPARDIPGIGIVRKVAKENLQEAALLILKSTIPYLIRLDRIVYPGTLAAYNDLIKFKGDK